MPTIGELVGTIGPVAAVLLGMWMLDRKQKAEAPPKEDPAAKLVSELRSIADRQIRIEAMLERILDR